MIVLYLLHLDPVMASRVLISCGISSVMLFYVRNHKLLPYLFQIYVASIGVVSPSGILSYCCSVLVPAL